MALEFYGHKQWGHDYCYGTQLGKRIFIKPYITYVAAHLQNLLYLFSLTS